MSFSDRTTVHIPPPEQMVISLADEALYVGPPQQGALTERVEVHDTIAPNSSTCSGLHKWGPHMPPHIQAQVDELKNIGSAYPHYQKLLLPQTTVARRENGRLRVSVFYVTCEDEIERVLQTKFYPVDVVDGRGVVGVIVGVGHILQDAVILARPPGGETSHAISFCPWRGAAKGFQKGVHEGKSAVPKEKGQVFQKDNHVETRTVSKRRRGQSPDLQSGQPPSQEASRVKSSLILSDHPVTNTFSSSRGTSAHPASSRSIASATGRIDFPPYGQTCKQPASSAGPARVDVGSQKFRGLEAKLKPAASLLVRNKETVERYILLKARGLIGRQDDPPGIFEYFLGDQADAGRLLRSRWHALCRSDVEGREIGIVVVQGFSHGREIIKRVEGTVVPVLRALSDRQPRFRPRSVTGEVRVRRPRPNSVASNHSTRSVINHESASFQSETSSDDDDDESRHPRDGIPHSSPRPTMLRYNPATSHPRSAPPLLGVHNSSAFVSQPKIEITSPSSAPAANAVYQEPNIAAESDSPNLLSAQMAELDYDIYHLIGDEEPFRSSRKYMLAVNLQPMIDRRWCQGGEPPGRRVLEVVMQGTASQLPRNVVNGTCNEELKVSIEEDWPLIADLVPTLENVVRAKMQGFASFSIEVVIRKSTAVQNE